MAEMRPSRITTMQKLKLKKVPTFLRELYHCLGKAGRSGEEVFLKLLEGRTTPTDRMLHIYGFLQRNHLLEQQYEADFKSDERASRYKANALFSMIANEYNEGLRGYTKSLMRAESQKMLGKIYFERSGALFSLGLYEQCLTDIARAISHGYPESEDPILADRRKVADRLRLESEEMPKYHEKVPTLRTRNPSIPGASNSIEIQTRRNGHRVVATKRIKIGDIIAIDEPLTSIIDEVFLYHCHKCLDLCYNPIPCDKCTETLYCSEDCKDSALESYHKYECGILLSLKKLLDGSSKLTMAVKMFFQSEQPLSDEILQLIQTVRNEKFEEQIQLEMTAAIMYHLVKKYTTRFTGPNGQATEESFKDHIVALLQVSSLQATGVMEMCPFNDKIQQFNTREAVAKAIYPLYAMFRHGCDPHVYPCYHGMKMVLKAVRTIKKGEEVLITFGPLFTRTHLTERRGHLRTYYHFCCTCRACKKNYWQEASEFPVYVPNPGDSRFFTQMTEKPDVKLAMETVQPTITRMQRSEKVESSRRLEKYKGPSIAFVFQQKLLVHCYSILGNKRYIH